MHCCLYRSGFPAADLTTRFLCLNFRCITQIDFFKHLDTEYLKTVQYSFSRLTLAAVLSALSFLQRVDTHTMPTVQPPLTNKPCCLLSLTLGF